MGEDFDSFEKNPSFQIGQFGRAPKSHTQKEIISQFDYFFLDKKSQILFSCLENGAQTWELYQFIFVFEL